MDHNVAFFILLTCLAVSDSVQGTLQFSANVPENAHAGKTVTSVRPAIGEGREEVRCEIVAGDKNRRFLVTNCVIQVARPLDYNVDPSYNLTVNVTKSFGNPEQLYVDVQVQDVEGYPPVYNDTCEMPTRNGPGKSGDLNLDMKLTAEGIAMDVGEVFVSKYIHYEKERDPFSISEQYIFFTDNENCLVQVIWEPFNSYDTITAQSLSDSLVEQCVQCVSSAGVASVVQFEIFKRWSGFNPEAKNSRKCYLGPIPETGGYFILAGSFVLSSNIKNHFTCKLPEDISISVFINDMHQKTIPVRLEFDFKPVGCPSNKYGVFCDQNCTCENGARCHGLNGACKCQPGWQGVVCDIPHSTVVIIATPGDSTRIHITGSVTLHCKVFHLAADRMMWTFPNKTEKWLQGAQEDRVRIHNIQSEHNGTYTCTVLTADGTAINASYELQAVACPPRKTGETCEEECVCSHGGSCDRWAGCVCPPGWTGNTCQTSCPVGTYGQGCSRRCRCQHDATCSPTDGRCNCTEGWFGSNCSRPCPAGLYGWKCRHVCACKNNATCHNVDGTCACVPPWTGTRCGDIKTDTYTYTFPVSLQIATPLVLTLLVAALVLFIVYKRKKARRAEHENNLEETMVVLELRNMEEDLAQSLQPGWLNRWERNADDLTLDELVGLGAFAQIRRGRLRTADGDVTVAVKSVRMEDRRCYRAFCREVAALIAVHKNGEEENGGHPNIVKLFGVVTISTPKCILLEFAAKGELLLILKQPRQNHPLGRFVRYAVQISRALEELRRLRIAHGDVAARNVLVSGDDVAKLADFGLAHDIYTETTYVPAVNDDVDELLPLKWMALESLESREFTCESDTWSFGVLLWEIATFGEEPSYQRQRQLSCPKLVGLLRQGVRLDRPPGCPDKLYDVMKSCWREEPSARPEPAELEQRLTGCGKELDPLLAVDN
ncbi:tyrosine-protein kinase receptor Tie-1-like [Branchiostoma floridae]|uniref:Tyrosine-protein kinase receptor Tie-1-like n=1 Tax=Branchiostoma floridae TaxID=7739 RepID=A0A9J7LQK7_BRAFL|nr:tyrosine-protein kinase receptor Tie-1-like [Branchiostoma floridae]